MRINRGLITLMSPTPRLFKALSTLGVQAGQSIPVIMRVRTFSCPFSGWSSGDGSALAVCLVCCSSTPLQHGAGFLFHKNLERLPLLTGVLQQGAPQQGSRPEVSVVVKSVHNEVQKVWCENLLLRIDNVRVCSAIDSALGVAAGLSSISSSPEQQEHG